MELSARERDVTMMALMLYATSEVDRRGDDEVLACQLADRATARDAYYSLLCAQAGVR